MGIVTAAAIIGGGYLVGSAISSYQAGQAHDDAMGLAEDNMLRQNTIAAQQLAFQKQEAAKLEFNKSFRRFKYGKCF